MIQIATYTSESRLNDWLEEAADRIAVRDIKFSSDGPHACRFMVIYETDIPEWRIPETFNNFKHKIESETKYFDDHEVVLNG